MSLPTPATPTLQANLQGARTTVNLRDWLNARLSPFLKKAIIDSLEAEAEYPLQWLGEHLIQQSILYEGNPDTTQIAAKFRYNHDSAAKTIHLPASKHSASGSDNLKAADTSEVQSPQDAEVAEDAVNGANTDDNDENVPDQKHGPSIKEDRLLPEGQENGEAQDTEMTDTT